MAAGSRHRQRQADDSAGGLLSLQMEAGSGGGPMGKWTVQEQKEGRLHRQCNGEARWHSWTSPNDTPMSYAGALRYAVGTAPPADSDTHCCQAIAAFAQTQIESSIALFLRPQGVFRAAPAKQPPSEPERETERVVNRY